MSLAIEFEILSARVAELVDALDLGSSSRKGVGVQVPSLAPVISQSESKSVVMLALLNQAKI